MANDPELLLDAYIGVDVGGTHTDVAALVGARLKRGKAFTTYTDFARGVLDAVAVAAGNHGLTLGALLARTRLFVNGTTVVTNAITTLSGSRVGVIVTPVSRIPSASAAARGPHVMLGYWNNPDLSATRMVDGWVHRGDIGYLDDDGYLHIVDRKEDMIITGGFNVWPAEIEDVIYSHPAIHEAAVFGMSDDRWGEAVCAVAARKHDQALDETELRTYLETRLTKYKVPKIILFRATPIPKSAVGKLLRRKVREEHLAELEAARWTRR